MKESFITEVIIMLCVVIGIWFFYQYGMDKNRVKTPSKSQQKNSQPFQNQSRQQVLDHAAVSAAAGLKGDFINVGVPYPPDEVALLAFKQEREMEVWAQVQKQWTYIRSYPILAASGVLGPKLVQGDRQVPEGEYRVLWLNPHSHYHLSMKINYPNAFDSKHARMEGRSDPGGDIFIHGEAVSAGCLAMGNAVIEQLFSLVEAVGVDNAQVIIAPYDMREARVVRMGGTPGTPGWLPQLYGDIRQALSRFPVNS